MGKCVSIAEIIEKLNDLNDYIRALELETYDYKREINYLKGELERRDREIIDLRRELRNER